MALANTLHLTIQDLESRISYPVYKKKQPPLSPVSSKKSKRLLEEYREAMRQKRKEQGEPLQASAGAQQGGGREQQQLLLDDGRRLKEKGCALLDEEGGDVGEALSTLDLAAATLKEAIRLGADSPEVYALVGDCLRRRDMPQDATEYYGKALTLVGLEFVHHNWTGVELYKDRAECWAQMGLQMAQRAADDYDSYMKLVEPTFDVLLAAGKAHLDCESLERCGDLFGAALELHEASSLLHFYLGELSERREDMQLARKHFARAVEVDPEFSVPYREQAEGLIQQKGDAASLASALGQYQAVLKLHPDDGSLHIRIADVHDLLGADCARRSLAALDDALGLAVPASAPALSRRGALRWHAFGEVDAAIADFTRCLRDAPQDTRALELRARALRQRGKEGDLQLSAADADALTRLPTSDDAPAAPPPALGDDETYREQAEALIKNGDSASLASALSLYQNLIKVHPEEAALFLRVADVHDLLSEGCAKRSLDMLDRALALELPKDVAADTFVRRGVLQWCAFGDVDAGIADLSRCLQDYDARHPLGLERRAAALRDRAAPGDVRQASEDYEALVQLPPSGPGSLAAAARPPAPYFLAAALADPSAAWGAAGATAAPPPGDAHLFLAEWYFDRRFDVAAAGADPVTATDAYRAALTEAAAAFAAAHVATLGGRRAEGADALRDAAEDALEQDRQEGAAGLAARQLVVDTAPPAADARRRRAEEALAALAAEVAPAAPAAKAAAALSPEFFSRRNFEGRRRVEKFLLSCAAAQGGGRSCLLRSAKAPEEPRPPTATSGKGAKDAKGAKVEEETEEFEEPGTEAALLALIALHDHFEWHKEIEPTSHTEYFYELQDGPYRMQFLGLRRYFEEWAAAAKRKEEAQGKAKGKKK